VARLFSYSVLLLSLTVLAGCATGPSAGDKHVVQGLLAAQKFDEARAHLDAVKETQYGQKNMVLFYLDRAAVLHHAGKYAESDADLDRAEQRMDELYTKSISQAGGMLLLNDTTMDYAGEPFERALAHVLRALNYVFLNQPDEALVESRKVELFLDGLQRRLAGKGVYSDDAFARYLDALLYADEGKLDDARISLEAARSAYADYQDAYGMPEPRFTLGPRDKKSGELVFIHYNGVAPRKVTKTFQVAWGQAMALAQSSEDAEAQGAQFKNALAAGITGNAITIAYPGFVNEPYSIVSSEVLVDSKPAASTLLMEDVAAIASKTLEDRMGVIKTRAVARAFVKYVVAQAAYKVAAKACDQMPGGFMAVQICKTAARGSLAAASAATEVADTRSWSTVPAQIRMARAKVPAGTHDVTVLFKDAAGMVVAQADFPAVKIDPRKRTYLSYRTAR
jgi:tetratricopeptide (TPR) repeat protein